MRRNNIKRFSRNEPSETIQLQQQSKLVRHTRMEAHFEGPIPPPSLLSGYEDLLPGAADRIITMAEKQQGHRIAQENKMTDAEVFRSKTGLIMGGAIILLMIISSTYLLATSKPLEGFGILVTAIAPIVVAMINNTLKNRQNKDKEKNSSKDQ